MTEQDGELHEKVRAWALGMYPLEAAAELLIRAGFVYLGAPWLVHSLVPASGTMRFNVGVDADRLLAESGVWSGGEQRLARVAASLLDGPPVNLFEDASSFDGRSLALVISALRHANGDRDVWARSNFGGRTR